MKHLHHIERNTANGDADDLLHFFDRLPQIIAQDIALMKGIVRFNCELDSVNNSEPLRICEAALEPSLDLRRHYKLHSHG